EFWDDREVRARFGATAIGKADDPHERGAWAASFDPSCARLHRDRADECAERLEQFAHHLVLAHRDSAARHDEFAPRLDGGVE
ncbi:hypothetical protein ACC691_40400, partial [Rhizobium johnstonii]|uniref:hypothetical protein n=1 Tax=Rhizobium johnstonii TaxID=3019933 RepID=UPI003F967A8F